MTEHPIIFSQELFEQVRDYFDDRAIIDPKAKQISAEIIEAWAFPFGNLDIQASLFNAIKSYLETRVPVDMTATKLLVQLWAAKEESDR